jgi:uncharacterized protein YcfJ
MSLRKFKSATVTTATVIAGLFSAAAFPASEGVDTAQVISASPIYERVTEPRQECSEAPAAQPKERSVIAPILGGLAGALIGRQVGHGNGRDVATAVGAAAGTMAGDAVANPDANRNYTGAAVGAVAGGVLGNQVGNGRGNGVATAAGTIAGTMAGDRLGARTAGAGRPAQNCRTVESSREIIKGYNVVYRFNGRDVTTTMPYDPGNTVRVGFGVIEDGAPAAERETRRDRMSSNSRDNGPAPANSNYSYRY